MEATKPTPETIWYCPEHKKLDCETGFDCIEYIPKSSHDAQSQRLKELEEAAKLTIKELKQCFDNPYGFKCYEKLEKALKEHENG